MDSSAGFTMTISRSFAGAIVLAFAASVFAGTPSQAQQRKPTVRTKPATPQAPASGRHDDMQRYGVRGGSFNWPAGATSPRVSGT